MSRRYNIVPGKSMADMNFALRTLEAATIDNVRALGYDMFTVEVDDRMVAASYFILQGLLDHKFIDGVCYRSEVTDKWTWLERREVTHE